MSPKPTHLAQFNVGRMRAPIDDPVMEGFRSQLERINAIADRSPGFVWRPTPVVRGRERAPPRAVVGARRPHPDGYGWAKQGSLPPEGVEPSESEGGCATNDGQRVTKPDADALADTFERMLADPGRVAKVREAAIQLEKDVRDTAKQEYGIDLPAENHDVYPIVESSCGFAGRARSESSSDERRPTMQRTRQG